MSKFFGPLDAEGRVPPRQQTRAVAFLISAHGALARQFAFALPSSSNSAWQTELNAQFIGKPRSSPCCCARPPGCRSPPWLTWLRPGRWRGFQGRSKVLRINPWRWPPTSPPAHMPSMPVSDRRPCCRSKPTPKIPSSWRCVASSLKAAGCCRRNHPAEGPGPRALPRRRQLRPRKRHTEVRKLWSEALEGVGIASLPARMSGE